MPTVFTLEAVYAKKGDSLLLHYGPADQPRWILIDGGPGGVYSGYLKPRLAQLKDEFELDPDQSLPLEIVMVSHIDDDHIHGILDLFDDLERAKDDQAPAPYAIRTLWHNSFDDVLGNTEAGAAEIVAAMADSASNGGAPGGLALPPEMDEWNKAVLAGTKQGRALRDQARKLAVPVNAPFDGLVMAPADAPIEFDHEMTFTVISPSKALIERFQKKWDKDLKKILEKEEESARAQAFTDSSAFNLASICVLAEMGGKTMLLTGDARGDHVLEGLEASGHLEPLDPDADAADLEPLHFDILKLPHHGSDRNVDDIFFERITADHYVVSGDGEHGNPEVSALDMLARSRGDDEYTIHFTFTEDQHEHEENAKRKAALEHVRDWVAQKPDNCRVVFREKTDEIFSIYIDLLDPLYPED